MTAPPPDDDLDPPPDGDLDRPPDGDLDRPPDDYADFYRATATNTFAVARGMASGDEHVAWDATQEAYVSMWRCWDRWAARSVRDAARYVVRIAVHKVADHFRGRRANLALRPDHEPVEHETGYDEVLGWPLRHAVVDLIDRQPERRRKVAILYFLNDFTYAEIAALLGITESTVRTHVERARVLIKPLVDIERNTRGGERS